MRLVYLTIGFVSLGLGIIGIPLPILPTTPFLLLSMACFAKSSKRFETWLYQTKLYQTYVADYRETKSIAKERKKWILLQIYILMGISIYSGTDYLGEACSRCFNDFYHLLSLKSDP